MKLLFMGTPDFAVYGLTALHQSSHEICGVVTVPDKPMGRGKIVRPSAVKLAAEQMGYSIFQPDSLTDPVFLEKIEHLDPEVIVVIAFRKLPSELIEIPVFGAINIHASLLPKYRGAAPIHHALLNGEQVTGVTSFYLNEVIDGGTILMQSEISIDPEDNFESLYQKLAVMGGDLIVETLNALDTDGIAFKVQNESEVSHAPKVFPEMAEIDWTQSAEQIHHQIRAFSPKPGAYTYWNGSKFAITKSRVESINSNAQPGCVLQADKTGIYIQSGDGLVIATEVQASGKKRMAVADFLNGNNLTVGTFFK